MPVLRTVQILGLPFVANPAEEALALTLAGGLVVVPSGPGLANDFCTEPHYRTALLGADFVLPDSGAMVLAWNLRTRVAGGERLSRLSGLEYLRLLIPHLVQQAGRGSFWVMPSPEDQAVNLAWLRAQGCTALTEDDCYLAPRYTERDAEGHRLVTDPRLVEILERRRPSVVVLNVGGGTQEPLGWHLRESLSYRPTILCTGAAIAFLTGRQANIPPWADRYYLGWFLRILSSPAQFGRRYWDALPLFRLIAAHGTSLAEARHRQ
ncbi:MAG: WecB/TagA/CpsF family glycosyltransferase [Verrucomicrobia bacterium]|nr:WecB/TagA/CpsF family glycosyltransferase [Verrucomicrobiota bacterium]